MPCKNLVLRAGEKRDCTAIIKLIQEGAEFEKMPDGPKLTENDLVRDCFEVNQPLFRCTVAELDNVVVGFALFYPTYSTWRGKCMLLNELQVTSSARGTGIGSKLFRSVAEVCRKENCPRLDVNVLSWNPARSFYERHGAVNIAEKEGWLIYRMHEDAMTALLSSS